MLEALDAQIRWYELLTQRDERYDVALQALKSLRFQLLRELHEQ